MTALALPDRRLLHAWARAVDDFGDPGLMDGSGWWNLPEPRPSAASREVCAELMAALERDADTSIPAAPGRVHSDYYWVVDDDRPDEVGAPDVVGFVAVRHELNASLLERGGHIGYSVRPGARGRGHATRALRLALRRAAGLGVASALLTTDVDNTASRVVIERCGGVLDDVRGSTRRYWVATGNAA